MRNRVANLAGTSTAKRGLSVADLGPRSWRRSEPLDLPEILHHARDAFYDRGYHGTSVRDISDRVGFTVPALYYHYASKQAILAALLEEAIRDVLTRVRLAAEESTEPVARFSNVVEALVRHMTFETRLAFLDGELRYLDPVNRVRYRELRRDVQEVLQESVMYGIKAGVFNVKHVDDTIRAMLGMFQSIPYWYSPSGSVKPNVMVDRYIDISLRIVGCTGS